MNKCKKWREGKGADTHRDKQICDETGNRVNSLCQAFNAALVGGGTTVRVSPDITLDGNLI